MESIKFLSAITSIGIPVRQEKTSFEQDASFFKRNILGVISPASQSDVTQVVRLANEHEVSLYPISGGKNWGYGSALPVRESAWLLDLSGLTRIIRYDPEQMAITLEPGVTQATLNDYLKTNAINAMTPNTGIGVHGNILGNILERGFGIAPLQDHASSLMSLKACLADGTEFQSFFRGLPHSIDAGYKWGVGPSLEPLFFQSGLGVITEATIKLARRPEHIELAVMSIESENDLHRAIRYGRDLNFSLPGQVQAFKIFDAPQIEKTLGNKSDSLFGVRINSTRICIAVLYSNPFQFRTLRKAVREVASQNALRGLKFFSRNKIELLGTLFNSWPLSIAFRDFARPLRSLSEYMRLAEGYPSSIGLNLLYPDLDNQELESVNPARDGKGIIWYAPIVPMKPELVLHARNRISELATIRGVQKPSMTITCVSESTAAITVPLLFDQSSKEKTFQLYRDLLNIGANEGFFPYRVPIEFMGDLIKFHPLYWSQVDRIRKAFDPLQTLAAGRYSTL